MRRAAALPVFLCLALVVSGPLAARESLGVFGVWGAFRDAETPRCYAIARAERSRTSRDAASFASVGTWPSRNVRGQFHAQLSRSVAQGAAIRLTIGDDRFELTGSGNDAWATGARMDAAIVAAMRSASRMSIAGRAANGRSFTDRYSLDGAATAMDAAIVGCSASGR